MYTIHAVVLNWNNADDTLKCVRSLRRARHVPDEIIVVDNGSTDSSESVLRTELGRECHIIQTGENLGYAGGMRVGAEYCLQHHSDLIWFMNNDTEALGETLDALLASVERNGLQCMYSPKILHSGDQESVYFSGRYLDVATGELTLDPPPHSMEYGAIESDLVSDVIQGASFIVPVQIIRELGFMDENYFLYFEEYDYSLRLARHGIKCICALSAVVLHRREGAQGSDQLLLDRIRTYYRIRNRILFWRRCCTPDQAKRFIRRHTLEQFRLLTRARTVNDSTAGMRLLALWHGLIGRSGRVYNPQ
ncbi:MAG: glycosyltransferase family 2 protein [Deltaproteobacteria bacterium]|nr:MAG: glycosyltransferase family 2 protein [Deltaproteobacteria bacterium]